MALLHWQVIPYQIQNRKNYSHSWPYPLAGKPHYVKERAKIASFTIKERQSLPVFNHYLIVFRIPVTLTDWQKRRCMRKKFNAVLQSKFTSSLCYLIVIKIPTAVFNWKNRR